MPLGKRRPLFTFDLDWPGTQGALRRKGFRKAGELQEALQEGKGDGHTPLTAADLATREFAPTSADVDCIRVVLSAAEDSPSSFSSSSSSSSFLPLPTPALALYQAARQPATSTGTKIISFCRAIDSMLGGGVQRGQLMEVVGVPGSGKTQLGVQLAIDAQIPWSFRGAGGKAVYIDTEGAFMAERAAEMGQALIKHLQRILASNQSKQQQQQQQQQQLQQQAEDVEGLTLERVLGNVWVFRCLNDAELLQTLQHLPAFLEREPEVAVIVIDGIALPFRQDKVFQTESAVAKARVVNIMARELNTLAKERNVAVVVTNQMTTKVDDALPAPSSSSSSSLPPSLAPTLGDSWAPAPAVRLLLWTNAMGLRCATLQKHPGQRRNTVAFRVTTMGIRDVSSSISSSSFSSRKRHALPLPPPPSPQQQQQQQQHQQQQQQQPAAAAGDMAN